MVQFSACLEFPPFHRYKEWRSGMQILLGNAPSGACDHASIDHRGCDWTSCKRMHNSGHSRMPLWAHRQESTQLRRRHFAGRGHRSKTGWFCDTATTTGAFHLFSGTGRCLWRPYVGPHEFRYPAQVGATHALHGWGWSFVWVVSLDTGHLRRSIDLLYFCR